MSWIKSFDKLFFAPEIDERKAVIHQEVADLLGGELRQDPKRGPVVRLRHRDWVILLQRWGESQSGIPGDHLLTQYIGFRVPVIARGQIHFALQPKKIDFPEHLRGPFFNHFREHVGGEVGLVKSGYTRPAIAEALEHPEVRRAARSLPQSVQFIGELNPLWGTPEDNPPIFLLSARNTNISPPDQQLQQMLKALQLILDVLEAQNFIATEAPRPPGRN